MYFEFFELKSWGKRSANNRRRFNQWLLKGEPLRLRRCGRGVAPPLQYNSPGNGNLLGASESIAKKPVEKICKNSQIIIDFLLGIRYDKIANFGIPI